MSILKVHHLPIMMVDIIWFAALHMKNLFTGSCEHIMADLFNCIHNHFLYPIFEGECHNRIFIFSDTSYRR